MNKRVARNIALLGLLIAVFAMAGCSCKEYEEQIMQLDAQIAEMQKDLADKDAVIGEREQVAEDLRNNLKDCQSENAVLIEQSEEVVMITVQEDLGFNASQVIVLDTMVPTLEAIARTVNDHPDWDVFVEGFTDDKKILEEFQEQYPSNWELGAFRSCAVVRYMTNNLDISADRFAAVSYGPFRALADNDTPEGRAQNRRVRFTLHKVEK
ncbi:MAG: OmpA family protein [Candidatus Krumholzibacteriota bacterium]